MARAKELIFTKEIIQGKGRCRLPFGWNSILYEEFTFRFICQVIRNRIKIANPEKPSLNAKLSFEDNPITMKNTPAAKTPAKVSLIEYPLPSLGCNPMIILVNIVAFRVVGTVSNSADKNPT